MVISESMSAEFSLHFNLNKIPEGSKLSAVMDIVSDVFVPENIILSVKRKHYYSTKTY